ncbi:hypothetical protein SBRCBS47491_002703 [Sporothrix bragantina]|uniref:Rhodopsin domain-containing protein n=1 Tax=Sporothrix bragantina TaxID=671064 RepID=A0ABP0B967_9PEZI
MADSFTTEAFTLLAIGLFFIFLRTYARLTKTGMSGFKADDYLMLLAAVVYAAETTLAYTVGAYWKGLANNGMTDAERAALSPTSEEYRLRVNGSKTQVAGWSTYTLLLWLLKASMCTFYLRLTDGLNYQLRIYIGFGMIFTTWVAVLLSILLGCRPLSKNWQIYPDPGNFCQPAISRIDIFVTVVLNVLTDIYLLSIPLPMLWKANLRPAKKMGLMVLFSGGIFVTMAGILRCVLIVTNPVTGAQEAGSWACRETFVAVVTSNLPMIFPLIRRYGSPFFSGLRSSMSKSKSKNTGGNGTGNVTGGTGRSVQGIFVLEDKNPRRGMGPRSVHPLPNMTFSESEEYIYNEQLQQQQEDLRQLELQQQQQQQELQKQKQNRKSRGSKHQGDIDIEHQALASRPSFQVGRSNSGQSSSSGSATLATVVPSGITKQVVLQITEEERQRRRASSDTDFRSNTMTALEAIPGARQGNYFLTLDNVQPPQQTHQQPSSSSRRPNISNPFTSTSPPSAASPLSSSPWDKDRGEDLGVDDDKRGSTGLTPSSRRR